MAKNFIRADRDQALLMPPSLKDWLPEDHLAWFVLESVSELDLSAFYARYRDDGWGRAAFEPSMIVAVLLYAYAIGVRSSREIERRLVEDVAFRVIAANCRPDHSTICRFRQTFEHALNELFVSVLGLCVRAGAVDPALIVIDGTKIAANASSTKNITDDQLKEFADQVFHEAEQIDAAEDALYGDRRGNELRDDLRDKQKRIEWIREQLAEQQIPTRKRPARVNTTDPDSRMMKTRTGFIQGYNAQLAVTEDQIIVAAELTTAHADVTQFAPMVDQAMTNLDAADADRPIDTVVADAGYYSDANAGLDRGPDILIAPIASRDLRAGAQPPSPPDLTEERRRYEQAMEAIHRAVDRRAELMRQLVAGDTTSRQVADELGISTARVWQLKHAFLRHGRDGLVPRPRTLPRLPEPPPPTVRERMLAKISTEEGGATYARRGRCVEAVMGQIKEVDGLRRFVRRGRRACATDLRMQATAHNLKKLWRRATLRRAFSSPLPLCA